MGRDTDTRILQGKSPRFQTTRWQLVQGAGNVRVLESLVSIYWKPLYFFIRRQGHDNESAKDLVQGFFSTVIERDILSRADPARGRFRTFLLAALTNFLRDEARAASRQKRGGGQLPLSLDFARGEREFADLAGSGESPERMVDRAWARSLWEQSISELTGDPQHLEAFKLHLGNLGYTEIARKTGLSEAAAKSAVHRVKERLRFIILDHLRATAADETELQAELKDFCSLLP